MAQKGAARNCGSFILKLFTCRKLLWKHTARTLKDVQGQHARIPRTKATKIYTQITETSLVRIRSQFDELLLHLIRNNMQQY